MSSEQSAEEDWDAVTVTVDWDAPTKVETVPSAIELMAQFDRSVVSHSHAKEALVATLRMHLKKSDGHSPAPRVLLMGPRGVGKTTLAEALIVASDVGSLRIDFGELAVTGADLPRALSALSDGELVAPAGVLFLDGLEHLVHAPPGAASTFDGALMQVDLLRVMDGLELTTPEGRWIACDQLLVCGAVAIEEPLRQTASQQELRTILDEAVPLIPEFSSRFDLLLPIDRLSAAQIAKSFALASSPFNRARRVISSLGGSFHCDPNAIEALARTCAISPVGGWAANRVIDRLLEQVLRSPDPAKPWRLGA